MTPRRKLALVALLTVAPVADCMGGIDYAGAQSAGPIETVAGYPGCGGNSTIRTIDTDFTCANKRTYTFQGQTRTVTVVTTFRPDGTGGTTYRLSAPVPFDIPVRIRSHVGVSSGPTAGDFNDVMSAGTVGPIRLDFTFGCGQVDIKAVLVGNGQELGRISGPYVCKPETPPTTVPQTTVPDTPPTSSPASSTPTVPSTVAPSTTPGTAGASTVPGSTSPATLPATGTTIGDIFGWGVVILGAGVIVVLAVASRKRDVA